jgi:hypothetical protein
MNTPNPVLAVDIDALRGDLQACERSPRSIPCPENSLIAQIGGRR